MSDHMEFHLTWNGPIMPHWPNGSWSVYQIDGDQIADRVVRAEIVQPEWGPAFYKGEVIARHSWCGYLGMTETLEEATALIRDHKAKREADAAKQAARDKR